MADGEKGHAAPTQSLVNMAWCSVLVGGAIAAAASMGMVRFPKDGQ